MMASDRDYFADEKIIRAKDLSEARRTLYDRYKHGYMIIDQKTVPMHGLMGLFGKNELEITYRLVQRRPYNETVNPYGNPMNEVLTAEVSNSDFEKNKTEILKKNQKSLAQSVSTVKIDSQLSEMTKQLEEMRNLITEKSNQGSDSHPTITKIQELLNMNDFSFSYIQMITEKIKKTFSLDELSDFDLVQTNVVDWIGESIQTGAPVSYKRPRVVILVGPTGVGKTTTLVKLAAQFIKDSRAKGRAADFCFISADSMRVGAVEQLSRFGEIVGKNVLKAQGKEDIQRLYEEYKDSVDAIFIDTGGYGPNDAYHIAAMKETLSVQGLNPEIYLAFMASTKVRDLHNIMQNYEPFGYQGVIVTKCDESSQYGNVISAVAERHKTISYITQGQNFTGTLAKGNVVSLLMRLEGFKIDRVHVEDKFCKDETSEEI